MDDNGHSHFFYVPFFPCQLMWLFQEFNRDDYCIQPTFLFVWPTQPKLQLKSSHNGAICCAVKFSIFSQWIQGWFVWISLINCSHLNYWCSSVKPAFPVTDCLCSQVILPLCYSSLSSIFLPFLTLSENRISILRFAHPYPPLFPPLSPLLCLFFFFQPPISLHPVWCFSNYVVFSIYLYIYIFFSIYFIFFFSSIVPLP